MNKFKLSAFSLALVLSVSIFAFPQKSKKKPVKKEPPKPQSMTVCEGDKMPEGYIVTGQSLDVECIKKNQTGKSFSLQLNDGTATAPTNQQPDYQTPRIVQTQRRSVASESDSPDEDVENMAPAMRQSALNLLNSASDMMNKFSNVLNGSGRVNSYAYFRESIDLLDDANIALYKNLNTAKNHGIAGDSLDTVADIRKSMLALWSTDRAFYKSDVGSLADKYGVKPVADVSGSQVVLRQSLLGGMVEHLRSNYDALRSNLNKR